MDVATCRTVLMVNQNKKDGSLLIRYLECHSPKCSWCQTQKAKKYYTLISTPCPMIMYYRVVTDEDAKSISYKVRQKGEFYLRIPLGGYSVMVTTLEINEWIPFPTDIKDDAICILKGWIANKNGHISSTRQVKHAYLDSEKPTWETYWVTKGGYEKVKKFLSAGNWNLKKKHVFTPTEGSVDWDVVSRFMEISGITVKSKIVKDNDEIRLYEEDQYSQYMSDLLTIKGE